MFDYSSTFVWIFFRMKWLMGQTNIKRSRDVSIRSVPLSLGVIMINYFPACNAVQSLLKQTGWVEKKKNCKCPFGFVRAYVGHLSNCQTARMASSSSDRPIDSLTVRREWKTLQEQDK